MKPLTYLKIIFFLLVSLNTFCQNRFPVRIDNKYGFIDKTGQLKIEPKFDEPFQFSNNCGLYIGSNLTHFVIDTNGITIKSFKENRPSWITKKTSESYNYGPYHYFSEGLLAVFDSISKKYGFINSEGLWVIEPQFRHVSDFNNGLAAVGFWTNDPDLTIATHSESARAFHKTVKWGFIDTSGMLVIDTLFYDFNGFENGICWVKNYSTSKEYFIDKIGNKINSDTISDKLKHCWVQSIDKDFLYQKGGKCLGQIYNYKTGLFVAREIFNGISCEGFYGFVDCFNNWVIPPQYLNVRPFSNGLSGVMRKVKEGEFKWGYINHLSDTIIPLRYDEITNFNSNGISVVCLDKKCGLLNKKDKKLTELEYDYNYLHTPEYYNGLILLYKNGKQHYLTEKGEVVWKEK
jgi:hypothetical protein